MNKDDCTLVIYTASDLLPHPYPKHGQMWGPWRFDARRLTLTHTTAYGDQAGYELPLKDFTSSAQLLDAIFQVSAKTWCTRADAGQLLKALDDLIDPQAHLCSGGFNKPFNPKVHLRTELTKATAPAGGLTTLPDTRRHKLTGSSTHRRKEELC